MNAIPLDKVIYIHVTKRDTDELSKSDITSEITQVSWLSAGRTVHHILAADDADDKATLVDLQNKGATPGNIITLPGVDRTTYIHYTEHSLISTFWYMMNAVAVYPDTFIIGGWAIRHTVWPTLIMKGLHYSMPIDMAFKSDPMSRYSTVRCLLDVSEIYMQGAYAGWRRYPPLSDFLAYLCVPAYMGGVDTVVITPEELEYYSLNKWTTDGLDQVEIYLNGMKHATEAYYA